jgi:hypothetical protein
MPLLQLLEQWLREPMMSIGLQTKTSVGRARHFDWINRD